MRRGEEEGRGQGPILTLTENPNLTYRNCNKCHTTIAFHLGRQNSEATLRFDGTKLRRRLVTACAF